MIASVGLIGNPVAHSLSPAMQDAAFACYDLPDRYQLWQTPAETLAARIATLRAAGMRGANVTLPHKTAVGALLDSLDPFAEAVGALNTVVRLPDGRLHGQNTDGPGFLRALAGTGFVPRGESAVLLGAGGAARAVAYALIQAGLRSLVVANRTLEHAEALLADVLAGTEAEPYLQALTLDDPALAEALTAAPLLINSTSVGLDGVALPLAPTLITPQMLVVDLIYRTTPLLQAAMQRGARTQDGLEMLVWQGALSFEAWTGRDAPVELMRAAAQQALKGRT